MGDILRNGEPTIAEAIRKNVAAWGLEDELLLRLRVEKVEFVGFDCKDTGDRYLTTLAAFLDRERTKMMPLRNDRGTLTTLPFMHFRRQAGRARVK